MAERRTILVCSCEDTMPLDADAIGRGCRGAQVKTANQLCRAEIERFRAAAASGDPLTVGCTQEAPLFSEVAGERAGAILFVNLRETAGWSDDAAKAGPKMAALACGGRRADARDSLTSVSNSEGVVLIYGRDERAIEAAKLLKDHLDVTVLIARPEGPRAAAHHRFSDRQGHDPHRPRAISARSRSSSTTTPRRCRRRVAHSSSAPPRDGAVSRCDLVLDLSGGAPLFPAADLRDGYLRADPGDPAAVLRAVLKARDLVGTFDKPRYITFTEDLCAHSRSQIVGCHRCLDLCPTGAIAPAGDHVAIDAKICAGCGQCAAVCPTGAAAYALPPADALMRKLRTLLTAYREAGGVRPVVLLHDEAHGAALIDALARHGDGLPANVLPLAVNEVTQIGLETIAAAFAYGASARAVPAARKAAPRRRGSAQDDRAGRADPRRARLRRRPRRRHRDRRSGCARRGAARDPALAAVAPARELSRRSAASATCCASRCANCIASRRRPSTSSRCPPARRSARSKSMSRAARFASPACRPARPARCRTIPSGRCCASPKMPACNAACARRPARKR